jgi:hypothetical protein
VVVELITLIQEIVTEIAIIILAQDVTMDIAVEITALLQPIQTQTIARIALGIGLMVIQTQINHQGQIVHKVHRLHHGEGIHRVVAHQVEVALVVVEAVAQEDQDRLLTKN